MNKEELDNLLRDYLPFVRKQLEGLGGLGLEYDDMLSLAMMVFVNCVGQYENHKGGFLGFTRVSIRNRLIDEGRKARRVSGIIHLSRDPEEGPAAPEEAAEAVRHYEMEQERQRLRDEIDELTARLEEFGITLWELAKAGPRQKRSRVQCMEIAREIVKSPSMRMRMMDTKRIPQTELAELLKISGKTIEKYRKYIVALVILLTGDYPGVQAFLPQTEEVGA